MFKLVFPTHPLKWRSMEITYKENERKSERKGMNGTPIWLITNFRKVTSPEILRTDDWIAEGQHESSSGRVDDVGSEKRMDVGLKHKKAKKGPRCGSRGRAMKWKLKGLPRLRAQWMYTNQGHAIGGDQQLELRYPGWGLIWLMPNLGTLPRVAGNLPQESCRLCDTSTLLESQLGS